MSLTTMKLTNVLLVLVAALTLAPAVSEAQGYYGRRGGPPPGPGYYGNQRVNQHPGGFWNRSGRIMLGGTLGLGYMNDDFGDIECSDCDFSTVSGFGSLRLGGFVGPRFALMGEGSVNIQTVSSDRYSGDTTNLVMGTLMVAGQFWVTPQLWVKGGVGFARLSLERSYYGDGFVDESSVPENGMALMGAVGYEILSSQRFSVDLEGRLTHGSFKGIDNNVTGGTIGLGINFF